MLSNSAPDFQRPFRNLSIFLNSFFELLSFRRAVQKRAPSLVKKASAETQGYTKNLNDEPDFKSWGRNSRFWKPNSPNSPTNSYISFFETG